MQLKRIHHVAIICGDYEQSKRFYTEVLGGTVIRETYRAERDSYKLDLRVGEHDQIELFSFPDCPARSSYPEARGLRHLAFAVESVDVVVAELQARGIAVEAPRRDALTGKKFTFFRDPDDLPLEVYEE